jgi:hypothetical protein
MKLCKWKGKSMRDKRLLMWMIMALISGFVLAGVASAQDAAPTTIPTPDPAAAEVVETATDAAQAITDTAGSLWARLTQPPQSDLALIVMVIGGILLLVAGWLVYEWIILIAGFLIGATTAVALVAEPNALVAILIFMVGGVIGAAVGALLYYVAVFLIGGYVGIVVTQALAAALSLTPVTLIPVIIGFVLGGIILLMLSFELLVIFSAIVGAQMIALALNLGLGWMLVIALVGIVIQLVAARSRGVEIRRRPVRRTLWVRET